jgi:probable rRNA maturation factor
MASINFFTEDIPFKLERARVTRQWLKQAIHLEGKRVGQLNFIFCSDEHLYDINVSYLQHETFTDIITFDNSDSGDVVEGDIFISVDRVFENSLKYGRPFLEELYRIMIHGTLHLLGYSDKGRRTKREMTEKEDFYLTLPSVPRGTFV